MRSPRLIISSMALCLCTLSQAQRHHIFTDDIASLQVVVNDDWLSPPIMTLGSEDVLEVAFDELSHTYHRYSYSIGHCEADWSTSEGLFTSDFIDGFQSDLLIEDYEESVNTNQLYNHYTIRIPNDRCAIKMSGNYRLDVFDDDSRDTVLTARFYVVEPLTHTSVNILHNTDIDVRHSHQQLELRIDYPASLRSNDPRSQFTVKVMQNERVDNMRTLPPATQLMQGGMQWIHCPELIFDGGNEYHKFEFLDPHRNSLGVDEVAWDGERYHVHVYHDYERRNYEYDEDANGSFYVRNSDNVENNTTTDYAITHFYLDTPPLPGDVYIEGKWSLNSITDKYLMEYDNERRCYTIALPLKMGYYSYQYLFVPRGKHKTTICPTEGNYYLTENKYTILTYFRGTIDRTDRLVGAITK